MVKGRVVNQEGAYLYDIDGSFLADCGTERRAIKVQKMLYNGKTSLDVVMMVFSNTGGKKSRVADIPASVRSDEDWGRVGDDNIKNYSHQTVLHPSPFPLNLSLVLRLSVISIIFPKVIIVLDKVVISSIPPNPPYYITIILIVSSDKDISPNTIISPDKAFALILIIVLDRATLQPLL